MPSNSWFGEGVLLPRSFRDGGALVGDTGFISYYSPTPSTIQEQRTPIYVAGFYDPGIIPIGGKYVLTSHDLIAAIRSSQNQESAHHANGINIGFDNIEEAPRVKKMLSDALTAEGLTPYWKIETYREYEFTKDIIQQLHSEKNLFSLISMIIILVACSNIISMLIILVNDKKIEIGILRSMGASSLSIAIIFGFCGIVMGTIGSIIGVTAALLTLYNLDFLVAWISRLQGHDLFNPLFFGNTLPNQISYDALALVIATTAVISLLAGIVPAVKASLLRPSAILRSE
jgi:lipoprotein-releasing system permease protein